MVVVTGTGVAARGVSVATAAAALPETLSSSSSFIGSLMLLSWILTQVLRACFLVPRPAGLAIDVFISRDRM
jgi:hypothetical protein